MHPLLRHSRTPILALVLILAAGTALAAPNVEVNVSDSAMTWQADGSHERLILTVSGPGEVYLRQELGAGETPSLGLFDDHGKALPDGSYTWELELVPALDSETRAALDEARATGDSSVVHALRDAGKLPQAEDTVTGGSFAIADGAFVSGGAVEPKAPLTTKAAPADEPVAPPYKDFVIADDLIVDGSACIGFDCVNGESFGFDTIRLKENNLRIKFQDTSGGSFPTRDWEIIANDSSNGGLNRFSVRDVDGNRIPFTLEANAPSNSLYVDDGGRLGLGTSIPVADIHAVSGNTPTLRLEQNGSSGFAPQTWDLAGNETSFFVRDATNGSTLPFRIRPGAPSQSLVIGTDGAVGVGLLTPTGDFHINDSSGNADFDLSAGSFDWRWRVNSGNGQITITNNDSNDVPFRIANAAADDLVQLGVNAANEVTVDGNIVATGTITPDYVFEEDYELESIEEHAEYMWTHKHLPAVGGATVRNGKHVVNLSLRAQGVLEELEKAHIYIEQLHKEIRGNQATIQQMLERLSELEAGQ